MVFTRLSTQEKEAFFELLDEYFQARPELFSRVSANENTGGGPGLVVTPTAAATAVQRALSATSGPSSSNSNTSTGVRSAPTIPTRFTGNYPAASSVSAAASNPEVGHAVGRVAAAALAFSGGNAGGRGAEEGASGGAGRIGTSPSSTPRSPPPVLPRRSPSVASGNSSQEHTSGSEVGKLVSQKNSVFSAFKKTNQAPLSTLPPAFAPAKNSYGPPPVRRVASTSETNDKSSSPIPPALHSPRVQPVREPEPEPQGEWAEALYDYESQDPADLEIKEGARILVTERTSDDWWTGEMDGKRGLFPASYVKLI